MLECFQQIGAAPIAHIDVHIDIMFYQFLAQKEGI